MIPLYGFLEGDTIGMLILAEESDTAEVLAEKLQVAARVRVKPNGGVNVVFKGQVVDARMTVGQAQIEPLDRFDVVKAGAS